jgi:hypothetical protein
MVNHKILFFVVGNYDTGSYNMKGVEPIIYNRYEYLRMQVMNHI